MPSSSSDLRPRLPLLLLCAALAAAIEWSSQREGRDAWPALWLIWASAFSVPAALASLGARLLRRALRFAVWLGTLFPAAAITFHQIAHEATWPHLALGEGGVQHWSRVGLLVGVALLGPAYALAKLERRLAAPVAPTWIVTVALAITLLSMGLPPFWPAAQAPRSRAAAQAPDVLLISIDTLRQDALACYGGRATALDPWIAQAQVLDGFAPSPWTLPSLRALMRGAAHSGAGGAQARQAPVETLPLRLQSAGYETAAFVSNAHLMSDYGFQKGFDRYDHADQIEALLPARSAKLVRWWTRQWTERRELEMGDRRADAALGWLEERDGTRPWFLWLHLIDPHLPYYLRGANGARLATPQPNWLSDLGEAFQGGRFFDLPGMRAGNWPQEGPFLAALRELYASEVDFAAWHTARVLERAQQRRGDRPLLWILTSDHGEEFFEHGGFEHGHALGQELLRVPLIFGGTDEPLPAAMRLQDIAPWLLRRLALLPLPAPQRLPESLHEWTLGGAAPACATPLLAGGMLYGDPQWRWIRSDGTSTLWRADASVWRNNVCEDRLDLRLSATNPDSSEAAVRAAAQAWWQLELQEVDMGALGDDLREQLRALGYLGG